MAQAEAVKNYWTLERGFITEATALQFPAEATTDESNFSISSEGKRIRRQGVGVLAAPAAVVATGAAATWKHKAFRWANPEQISSFALIVRQVGHFLYFFWDKEAEASLSNAAFMINLYNHKAPGATDDEIRLNHVSMSSGKGELIVVGPYIEPLRISYGPAADELTVSVIVIQERDFDGVDDGLGVNERPTVLSDAHNYNLLNQGWPAARITSFNAALSEYPGNADRWYTGKVPNATATTTEDSFLPAQIDLQDFGTTHAPRGRFIVNIFDTEVVAGGALGAIPISTFTLNATTVSITTTGAHGLSINDPINIYGSTYSFTDSEGIGGLQDTIDGAYVVATTPSANSLTVARDTFGVNFLTVAVTNPGAISEQTIVHPDATVYDSRLRAVSFFAGRAWYAGLENPALSANVYFSQIITSNDKFGKCYQEADPTSEYISDIIATDGGRITIPGAGRIVGMRPVSGSLIVFATQGVWEIGPTGGGSFFSATGFSVRRLTGLRVLDERSIVEVDGFPVFWCTEGIYAVVQDSNTGFLSVRSLTEETIQSYYNTFSDSQISEAYGAYDDKNKVIYWLHESAGGLGYYDRALVIDVRRGAFMKYTFAVTEGGPRIRAAVTTRKFYSNNKLFFCTMGEELPVGVAFSSEFSTEFLVITGITGTSATLATISRDDFLDWGTTDPGAFLLTAYELSNPTDRFGGADATRMKNSPYVFCYFDKTETEFADVGGNLDLLNQSGCLMSVRWNWTDHSNSGKFTPTQQVYRHRRLYTPSGVGDPFETGEPVIVTRNKIRGSGRAMQVKFEAQPGKDCRLIGWSVHLHMNPRP